MGLEFDVHIQLCHNLYVLESRRVKEGSLGLLGVISEVGAVADQIRVPHPDLARRLSRVVEALTTEVGWVTVGEAAAEFEVSRPTVYDWIKRGLLESQIIAHRTAIPAWSVITILPAVRVWHADGRKGRPSRRIEKWYETLKRRELEATEQGRRRIAGGDPERELEVFGTPY